jgi:hypothetical protein
MRGGLGQVCILDVLSSAAQRSHLALRFESEYSVDDLLRDTARPLLLEPPTIFIDIGDSEDSGVITLLGWVAVLRSWSWSWEFVVLMSGGLCPVTFLKMSVSFCDLTFLYEVPLLLQSFLIFHLDPPFSSSARPRNCGANWPFCILLPNNLALCLT